MPDREAYSTPGSVEQPGEFGILVVAELADEGRDTAWPEQGLSRSWGMGTGTV